VFITGIFKRLLNSRLKKKPRDRRAVAAFAGSAGLIGSGAYHDYKSLTAEKRLGKFHTSAYPKVQRVREKAYATGASPKAEVIRKSVSGKYNTVKHRLGKFVDRHAAKATHRYVASSVLGSLGAGLLLGSSTEND